MWEGPFQALLPKGLMGTDPELGAVTGTKQTSGIPLQLIVTILKA